MKSQINPRKLSWLMVVLVSTPVGCARRAARTGGQVGQVTAAEDAASPPPSDGPIGVRELRGARALFTFKTIDCSGTKSYSAANPFVPDTQCIREMDLRFDLGRECRSVHPDFKATLDGEALPFDVSDSRGQCRNRPPLHYSWATPSMAQRLSPQWAQGTQNGRQATRTTILLKDSTGQLAIELTNLTVPRTFHLISPANGTVSPRSSVQVSWSTPDQIRSATFTVNEPGTTCKWAYPVEVIPSSPGMGILSMAGPRAQAGCSKPVPPSGSNQALLDVESIPSFYRCDAASCIVDRGITVGSTIGVTQ